MKYTELEARVFNFLVEGMQGNGIFDTAEIAEALELPVPTVKGVLGSLTQKGKVECDPGDRFVPPVVWPIHPKHGVCFWADQMPEEEIIAERIEAG